MSISSLSSSSFIPLLSTNNSQQRQQDFSALASSIKAGDITGAQTALTAFEQDLQSVQGGAGNGNPLQDLKTLQTAIGAKDVNGVQKAFDAFLQDLKQVKSHLHHHKHHYPVDQGSQPAANTSGINVTA
jgi:hypothetical protein